MASRCPLARRIGAGILRDHRLLFRGVADVEPRQDSVVHGALWSITRECEESLDEFEGHPHLYGKRLVTVTHHKHCEVDAMVYTMQYKTSLTPPSADYRALIAKGYSDFGVPIEQLDAAVREAEDAYHRDIWEIRRAELTCFDSQGDAYEQY
jgi:gamma-glutamylcyclotransferase (GGCT)/AIG2-like uncharacterized protein YtfP